MNLLGLIGASNEIFRVSKFDDSLSFSRKNICLRAFCLAPNERERENENPVSLEYVKKSKTDFDFFPDKGLSVCHA